MTTRENHWILLSKTFSPGMKNILDQHYFGAQFIALTGRYLIQQRGDDSNTSMVYDSHQQSLVGETFQDRFRLSLNLADLSLILHEKTSGDDPNSLIGLTWKEAYEMFRQMIINKGISHDNLKDELHYDLPDHELLSHGKFNYEGAALINETIAQRHNADLILNEVIANEHKADPIRIWPHHFDTGTIIPLGHSSSGELIQSAGLGWAIPDTMVDEPYFYLSVWSKDKLKLPDKMPGLAAGNWMTPGWNGAVLKLSEIIAHDSAEAQYDLAISFFTSGLQAIRQMFFSYNWR